MRILVCGSRYWSDKNRVYNALKDYPKDTIIITGGARGADSIAHQQAILLGLTSNVYMANWKLYGLSAGPRRNQEMLDSGKPDLVIAFHENLKESKGTSDMVKRAGKNRIPVKLIS